VDEREEVENPNKPADPFQNEGLALSTLWKDLRITSGNSTLLGDAMLTDGSSTFQQALLLLLLNIFIIYNNNRKIGLWIS